MDERSKHLRRLVIQALDGGGRGHVGSAMSLIEILRVLYDSFLRFRADEPDWPERDRLILSKGHGCLALYSVLADKGFFPPSELMSFCKPESRLGGHPELGKLPGIEATTGALGHGFPIGVGIALAGRIRRKDYRVVVVVGDGELDEGSIWESAMAASKHHLSNLTVFVDYNKLQSYGPVSEVLNLESLADKWRSFGFQVAEVDGHDVDALEKVVAQQPLSDDKPSLVVCHTVKGKGIKFAEGNATWHHKSRLKSEEIEALYKCLE